ncbi:hypothetical protein ON010_g923 [Phytophthora cinnamomi]|nr:hypothetical protein ON010_g923 [Phytophthora cinnamomi]
MPNPSTGRLVSRPLAVPTPLTSQSCSANRAKTASYFAKSELVAVGYSDVAIDAFWETFVDYLAAMETRSHAELVQDFQTEGGESEYLVWYMRLLTAGYMKQHAETFQPFIDGLYPGQTVAQFCAAEVSGEGGGGGADGEGVRPAADRGAHGGAAGGRQDRVSGRERRPGAGPAELRVLADGAGDGAAGARVDHAAVSARTLRHPRGVEVQNVEQDVEQLGAHAAEAEERVAAVVEAQQEVALGRHDLVVAARRVHVVPVAGEVEDQQRSVTMSSTAPNVEPATDTAAIQQQQRESERGEREGRRTAPLPRARTLVAEPREEAVEVVAREAQRVAQHRGLVVRERHRQAVERQQHARVADEVGHVEEHARHGALLGLRLAHRLLVPVA